MTRTEKKPSDVLYNKPSPEGDGSVARVDVKAFHDALGRQAERKKNQGRALARQLAASAARRTSMPAIGTALAGRRRRSKAGAT